MVVVCESDIKLTVVMNGRDLVIDLGKKKSTIKDLKLAVFERFGIPVDEQIYSNKNRFHRFSLKSRTMSSQPWLL